MKKVLYTVVILITTIQVQAQLAAGDIMIVTFDADGKNLAFVALTDVTASTTFYISDNEWNGSAIGAGGAFIDQSEGNVTWTTASLVSAGTVVQISDIGSGSISASTGTATRSSGSFNPSGSASETVYVYSGSDDQTPTVFLTAFSNDDFTDGTLAGTSLTDGTNALGLSGEVDISTYTGSTVCNDTQAACAAAIAGSSNWTSQNASGDQSNDATIPDWPGDVPSGFSGTVLPVEWLDFTVSMTKLNQVLIEWTTASEIDNDFFDVEWSTDQVHFTSLGQVDGSGTTEDITHYHFTHQNPAGGNFYRIKQTDFDGQSDHSKTVYIHLQLGAPSFRIYPNPAFNEVVVDTSMETLKRITLYSISGELLMETERVRPSFVLDISSLPKGPFVLQVHSEASSWSKTILKD